MNVIKFLAIFAIAITISACGEPNDFEWFPDYQDTTPPVITTKTSRGTFKNNSTNHVTLNDTIVFVSNEPVTIYYTTNGNSPTNSPNTVTISLANGSANGPLIEWSNFIFKVLGVDNNNNKSEYSYTVVSP
jgi:hypothetical protein